MIWKNIRMFFFYFLNARYKKNKNNVKWKSLDGSLTGVEFQGVDWGVIGRGDVEISKGVT